MRGDCTLGAHAPKINSVINEMVLGAMEGFPRLAPPSNVDAAIWQYEAAIDALSRKLHAEFEPVFDEYFETTANGVELRPGKRMEDFQASEDAFAAEHAAERAELETEHCASEQIFRTGPANTSAEKIRLDAWYESAFDQLPENDYDAEDALVRCYGLLRDAVEHGGAVIFEEPALAPMPASVDASMEPQADGAPAFPRHCLDVGGPLGDTCAWLNATAPVPQPVLSLGAALVAFGALFGRRYRAGPLNTMTNLLGIGLARTGGGKDHARKQLKRLFFAAGCERFLMGDEVTSGAAIRKALGHHPSLVGFFDEFGKELQAIKSFNATGPKQSVLTTIMKLYGDSGSVSLATEYAASAGAEYPDIHFPSLNIWATTTPETFCGALDSGDSASGFLNRWVVLEGNPRARMRELDFGRSVGEDQAPEWLVDWVKRAATFTPDGAGNLAGEQLASVAPEHFVQVRVLDDGAREALKAVLVEQDCQLAAGGAIGVLWARYLENTIKVASIRAIADNHEAPAITAEHATWARDLVRWCIENMAFNMRTRVADSRHEQEMNLVLNFLRRRAPDWVAKDEISRGVRSISGKRRGEILAELANDQGIIEMSIERRSGVGRPTVRYRYVG